MKMLGNPWMVGGLCVIAVGLVAYQVAAPRRAGGTAPAPNGPALVPAASPANPAPGALAQRASNPGRAAARTTPGTNGTPPATLVDQSYVQSHLAQWLESPQRDPFLVLPAGKAEPAAVSPVSHWKLKAIWRQTGSRLAAINQGVYAEGEQIEGYKIEQIESDRVWFQGPTGRESLGFTKPQPPTAAPAGTKGAKH